MKARTVLAAFESVSNIMIKLPYLIKFSHQGLLYNFISSICALKASAPSDRL